MTQFFEVFFATALGSITLKVLLILLILVICAVLIRISKRVTAAIVKKSKDEGNMRAGTIATLVQSTLKYVIYFVGFAMIMGQCGINIAPILASAGIVGVAVAFGAQSLVKDVITGLFIMLEDSYSVGDYIKAAGVSGLVIEAGLRTTKIRDWGNETHIIPNGSITVITNYSKVPMTCFLEIPVAYNADADKTLVVLNEALAKLNVQLAKYTSDIRVLGINSFAANRLVYKLAFTASVNDEVTIDRAVRLGCKNAFDAAGIDMINDNAVAELN